jgi:hypothetical protein
LQKLQAYALLPAALRRKVAKAIDHGTVAVHQNRPAICFRLVRLHPDTEVENHTPAPAIIQGDVEFGTDPLEEGRRGDEEDKKSIRICWWWLLHGLQLTNCPPKKSLCPISRRLKT